MTSSISLRHKLKQDSDLLIDQIRAIDNNRFSSGPLTTLTRTQLKNVYHAVCEVMGIELYFS